MLREPGILPQKTAGVRCEYLSRRTRKYARCLLHLLPESPAVLTILVCFCGMSKKVWKRDDAEKPLFGEYFFVRS